jgi:hypothetical protein
VAVGQAQCLARLWLHSKFCSLADCACWSELEVYLRCRGLANLPRLIFSLRPSLSAGLAGQGAWPGWPPSIPRGIPVQFLFIDTHFPSSKLTSRRLSSPPP